MRHIARILLALVLFSSCASPDDTNFGESVDLDASTDVKSDKDADVISQLCNLSSCPVPPGTASKCCAGKDVCGYTAGSVCYPDKDAGDSGGKGGNGP